MPDLKRVFLDYDLNFLRVIADLWGVELRGSNQRDAAEELSLQLLQPDLVAEVAAVLSPEARLALERLRRAGRLPLAQFLREFGDLRAMGQAKRDREQPWRNQPSTSEQLWYRGFIARAFFAERDQAPQEFIFVPDDLQARLPAAPVVAPPALDLGLPLAGSRAASAGAAPDDATTMLAYLQIASVELTGAAILPRHREAVSRFLRLPDGLDLMLHLTLRLGLAEGMPLKPEPTRARPFLEAPRAAQEYALASAWRESKEWNDLLHVPGLVFEGAAWRNDPYLARQAILKMLGEAPPGQWWPVEAFIQAVKTRHPDFQRPSGDYDSWYIRDVATKASLRGFAHWDQVDGALVRWLLEKPLFWLGIVELGSAHTVPTGASLPSATMAAETRSADVFRVTPLGVRFLAAAPDAERRDEPDPPAPSISVEPDGTLRIPVAVSRYDRFQIARVCNWLPLEPETYIYRLSPASLARASRQSIKVSHILAFLQKSLGELTLPPHLASALQRWERAGQEAAVKEMVTLKLKSPEMLENLWRMPGVKRYLGEKLSPTLVEVHPADIAKLRKALAELGILAD